VAAVAADKSRGAAAGGASRGARLASYLQARSDDERARLARELHDNLGGLLVAAKMDLNHMERERALDPGVLAARVARVRDALDAAITLNRRLIEALEPGLLVHIGLCAALRWYIEDTCLQAGRAYSLSLPSDEVALKHGARLALFRIAQDALSRALAGSGGDPLAIELVVHDDVLEMSFRGAPAAQQDAGEEAVVLSMRHRITGLGGTLVSNGEDGSGRLSVRLPLANQTL
jgi:signal transduction histidine kinase